MRKRKMLDHYVINGYLQ